MKIIMLLDKGYGGHITYDMYKSCKDILYTICLDPNTDTYIVISNFANNGYNNIIFRSYNDAQRFLKYEENIKLLDDFFGK